MLEDILRHKTNVIPIATKERGIPVMVAVGIMSSAVGLGDLSLRYRSVSR